MGGDLPLWVNVRGNAEVYVFELLTVNTRESCDFIQLNKPATSFWEICPLFKAANSARMRCFHQVSQTLFSKAK